MVLSLIQQDNASSLTIVGVATLATAFVTVAAALLYLLGFLALVVPIHRITGDFSTALYATSLFSKTVVAAQGIRIFAHPFFLTTLLVLLLNIAAYVAFVLRGLFLDQKNSGILWTAFFVFSILGFVWLLFRAPSIITLVSKNRFPEIAKAARTWDLVMRDFRHIDLFGRGYGGEASGAKWFQGAMALITTLGLYFALTARDILVIDGGVILLASIWYFGTIFIASVPMAVSQTPPLPKVIIIGAEKPAVSGSLIDHSNGVWHLLDENGTIRAIPDGQVKVAHIMRRESDDFAATIKRGSEKQPS